MTKKAKGKLPCNSWLIRNGYSELVKCMKEHPERFKHIEQEKEPIQGNKND